MLRRAGVLGLVVCALLVAGLSTLEPSLLALALPPLVYLAVGSVLRPYPLRLRVQASLSPTTAKPGEIVTVEMRVTNGDGRLEELEIHDLAPAGLERIEGDSCLLCSIVPGGSQRLNYRLRAKTGFHSFEGVQLTATDPFGLFESRLGLGQDRSLLVRPEVQRLRRLYLRRPRVGAQSGGYAARVGGPGIEFYGIRGYTPGDPWRWINWKVSGRFPGDLFVNVFEQDRIAEIGLIVDARFSSNLGSGPESALARSIQAAASLSELLLSQGNQVGLLVFGSHLDWTVPRSGKVQRERILGALARASPGHSQIFDQLRHLPSRLFPPQTQLILFSPLLRSDVDDLIGLRARRYPLLVISPDQVELEARSLPAGPHVQLALRLARVEQAVITRRLAHAGVFRLLWEPSIPFEQLTEMYLSRPSPWLASIGARL
ncbi:MAG: DUF58 domain-containing protein [Anaerolineales bacterium]